MMQAVVLGLLISLATFLQAEEPAAARPSPAGPVSPDETLALFQLHPDCHIELVACEPDVIDPVHIAFDPDGRMWVVEYSDYPNGPGEGQPGMSRIRVLTDEDGDGRYGEARIFADRLLFANGLTFWRDGVIVTLEGAVEFMRDTDGDGRADERLELFSGFTPENPQLRANHPTFALDNHIYIANGLRGGDVVAGKDWHEFFSQPSTLSPEPVSLSGRDFRFDPLTGAYEAVSGLGQFGMSFDDWGNRFVCSNRNPCDHVVLEDRYLRRNPDVAVPRVMEQASPAAENSRIYPISRFWTTSNLHAGQFTAACGICIYRGDALPASFYGNSFVCDPTGNLVHCDVLKPRGATFASNYLNDGVEFLASTDEWFRPVNLTYGPDGALYVVDMYRAVIEHPQFMPDELKTRPDLTLGNDRGRIYRIVDGFAPATDPQRLPKLTESSTAELVELLNHPNAWQRETAQRLLLESDDEALPALLQTAIATSSEPRLLTHATSLCLARGWLEAEPLQSELYRDLPPRVIEHLLRVADEFYEGALPEELRSITVERLRRTDDARLRFQSLLVLAGDADSRLPADLLAQLALDHADDEWLQAAIRLNPVEPVEFLGQLLQRLAQQLQNTSIEDDRLTAIRALISAAATQVGTAADAETLSFLVRLSREHETPVQFAVLQGVCSGLRRRGTTLEQFSPQAWELSTGVFETADVTARQRQRFPDPQQRSEAVKVLEFGPTQFILGLIDAGLNDPEQSVRLAVIDVLTRRPEAEIGPALVGLLSKEAPAVRRVILTSLFSRPERISLLLNEVESGRVAVREIELARAEQLREHADPAIRERALALLVDTTAADRQQVIADYQPVLALESDPLRGREVFVKNCRQCHKIGDVGVNVAPDVSDSRTKTPAELLTSILDPNRAIDNNYFSYTILDLDGVVYTGVIAAETATSVTLRQAEGKEVTLLRTDIDELKNNGVSLMPAGLEKDIDRQQMADLISFIKNWRYLDGAVPREVIR